MVNVVVSNNTINYEGFRKLKTLNEVLTLKEKIGVLVYHKSNEKVEDKVEVLTKLKDRVNTFVYIRNKDVYEQAVQMIVVGSGGKYFDDEFFLESGAELTNLVSNLSEVTELAELGGVGVLSDFFSRYLKEGSGSTGFNKTYLSIVKSAVSEMITGYKQKDMELFQLSETATELFSNSVSIISSVEEEREKLKSAVESLEAAREEGMLFNTGASMPSVYFFPRVQYLKEKTIIRIKEVGDCSFLTSFILGFQLYLERIKYVRPKVIFIYSVGGMYEIQYKDFNWVKQNNCKTMSPYYNKIVFTNYPNKDSLSRLLDDTDYDTFIVVDRMKSTDRHILNSKGLPVKYAVSGESVLKPFNVKKDLCFSSKNIGSMFTLKYDSEYPKEAEQRERYYLREYADAFDKLYTVKRI